MAGGITKIFVAGHGGMVGSAILRKLSVRTDCILFTTSHQELDLRDQRAVRRYLQEIKPDQIYLAAARVGGIHANDTYPADFIYDNLMIASNVIEGAHRAGVKRLLFLGSSCIYPRAIKQPMSEEALLSGVLEPTNEPYAIAKIAGIKLCESFNRQYGGQSGIDYRSVMPTNLYGPGDNYHGENSHVIPALIKRLHEAKLAGAPVTTVWGTGKPRREFLFVDDMADACIHVMDLPYKVYAENTDPMLSHINVGFGTDVTIEELVTEIAATVGYEGNIVFDKSRPDGVMRKLMDTGRLNALGWTAKIGLRDGLRIAYQDFLSSSAAGDLRRSI